jgi:hypothetical protein
MSKIYLRPVGSPFLLGAGGGGVAPRFVTS